MILLNYLRYFIYFTYRNIIINGIYDYIYTYMFINYIVLKHIIIGIYGY
jgi:hypothetical protein